MQILVIYETVSIYEKKMFKTLKQRCRMEMKKKEEISDQGYIRRKLKINF